MSASTSTTIELPVSGMHCAGCAVSVERACLRVAGVDKAEVNVPAGMVRLTLDASDQSQIALREALTVAIEHAGFTVPKVESTAAPVDHRDQELLDSSAHMLTRIRVAVVAGVPVAVLGMSHGVEVFQTPWAHWTQAILTTPIVVWCAAPITRAGWHALRHGRANMHSLVSIGVWTAYIASMASLIWPDLLAVHGKNHDAHPMPVLFFESAAIITMFVLLGRILEARALRHTTDALRALARLQPNNATVERDGHAVEVEIDALRQGDLVVIRPGERIPVDGIVESGTASIDESSVTGEPLPIDAEVGLRVKSGTLALGGSLRVRATATGAGSTLARIMSLVQEAQGSKARIQHLVDKVAAWFTLVVLIIAVGSGIIWFLVEPTVPAIALSVFVAVLVVACPCALGLATPTAVSVGVGRAARAGILFRGADVFERARSINTVIIDKTGTLTLGRPDVTGMRTFTESISEERLLTLAASAEHDSEHPLAHAVMRAATARGLALPRASQFSSEAGGGVAARVDQHDILVGRSSFLHSRGLSIEDRLTENIPTAASVLWVAVDGSLAGVLFATDTIRPDATRAVLALKNKGMRVIMATGDRADAAVAVARAVGITMVHAEMTPEKKHQLVREMQRSGARVAFAGDGINDAPALAQADLALAMGTGTDAARDSAGVILLREDISVIADTLTIADRTLSTIHWNLIWAFAYNAACLPLAAGVALPHFGILLTPSIAGAAMAFSSVSVVLNSLRLGRMRLDGR
ncbi:MAG: heavy metal translocating P-type ATPase [Planctomycetota bacterium]|nr:heavy metal translocating P-type ATPase [Planctomycetota bacterium]